MKSLRLMHITLLMMVGWLCVSCNSRAPGSTASAGNGAAPIPTVDAVRVVSQKLKITVHLPGELQPYEVVAIYPKV
jgi:multidrug efflux pump subunit AcrA (membrane-fusion protein)